MTLSPHARAIAALVLAVTVILGSWTRVGFGISRVLGQDDGRVVAFLVAAITLGVCAFAWTAATSAARAARATPGGRDRWELHLAEAARLLVLFAGGIAVVELLGALVEGGIYYR